MKDDLTAGIRRIETRRRCIVAICCGVLLAAPGASRATSDASAERIAQAGQASGAREPREMRAPAPAPAPTAPAPGAGFEHRTVVANGVRLHYVVAGRGEPVLLLPGWPQDWYAWRSVMERLAAAGRQVYALDPRGFGDSEKPASGYDLDTSAEDIHAFIGATRLARAGGIDVVSHDLGVWIAYAHASAHPEDVHRLVMTEATIPGAAPPTPIPNEAANVKTWHFAFNRLNDLPETLVQGHERAYLTWLFMNKSERPWTIDAAALDEYVRAFSSPGAARAGFDYYRQVFSERGLARMRERLGKKLPMPVLAVGAEGGVGGAILQSLQPAATTISGLVLEGCGHYLPDECAPALSDAVLRFLEAPK